MLKKKRKHTIMDKQVTHLQPKVYVKRSEVSLIKVSYDEKEPNNSDIIKLRVADSVILTKFSRDSFEIQIERSLSFKPESIFAIKIIAGAKLEINQELTNDNFESEESEKEYIEKNLQKFANHTQVCKAFSMTIAQLTSVFGRIPIITSDEVVEK